MLNLKVKKRGRVFVGDNIIIHYGGQSGNRGIIGIEAPSDVPIEREEVRERRLAQDTPPEAGTGERPSASKALRDEARRTSEA